MLPNWDISTTDPFFVLNDPIFSKMCQNNVGLMLIYDVNIHAQLCVHTVTFFTISALAEFGQCIFRAERTGFYFRL